MKNNFSRLTLTILLVIIWFVSLDTRRDTLFAEDEEEKPAVFKVILKESGKEIVGILKMHFKKKFEAESEHGLINFDFNKLSIIEPVDVKKKIVKITLVSEEVMTVKLINSLFLDKTIFGKYEIHLDKIEKIISQKD